MLRAWRSGGTKRQRTGRLRPTIELLEDRTLPSFVAAPTFPVGLKHGVGSKPVALVTGDFNGDGILDVATANQQSNTVSVLLGVGNGTFKPGVSITLGRARPR